MSIRSPVPRHLSLEWLRQKRRRQIIPDRFKIEFLRKLYGEVTADNTVATVSFPVSSASRPIKNGDRLLAEDQDPLAGVKSLNILFASNGKRKNSAALQPILRPSRISIFRAVALTRFTKYGDACCRCNETRPLPSSATTALQYHAVPTLCAQDGREHYLFGSAFSITPKALLSKAWHLLGALRLVWPWSGRDMTE